MRIFASPEARDELLHMVSDGATNDDLGAHFGVSTRTLERHRAADPELNAAILSARAEYFEANRVGHGSRTRYNHGCRCFLCRVTNAAHQTELRNSRRGKPIPPHVPHGTASTYGNWNCRCRPCTIAHGVRQKRRRLSS